MTNQEAIEELKDMAFHPSVKKSLSIKCIATCISALIEQKQLTNQSCKWKSEREYDILQGFNEYMCQRPDTEKVFCSCGEENCKFREL